MKELLNLLTRGVNATLLLYENKLKSRLMAVKAVSKKITASVKKKMQAIIGFLFGKPSSAKDYFHVTGWYLSKRFFAKVCVIVLLGVLVTVKIGIPFLSGRLWPAVLVVNSNPYHEFTGKCKVMNQKGELIYMGKLYKGEAVGIGELYEGGQLIYKGEFQNNAYEGKGVLYTNTGQKLYEGEFSESLYHGKGTLYYETGEVQFAGTFVQGKFETGVEYYRNGNKKYSGAYENGNFTGVGGYYETDGRLRYFGEFVNGRYHGNGRIYRKGILLYEGQFADNLYHGQGKLYEESRMLYEGGFSKGSYDGEGSLYEAGTLAYKGGFLEGKKNGQGILFSAGRKTLLYEGNFKDGFYDGDGKLYEEESGRLLYEGAFAKGLYQGQGTLYSAGGQKLFTGGFYGGEIDYLRLCRADIDEVREKFGREDSLFMLENSFLLVYRGVRVMFEFPFVENEEKAVVYRIRLFGTQEVAGASINIKLSEFEKALEHKSTYTSYPFTAGEGEALMSAYTEKEIQTGDTLYCMKYIFEDYYIRAYSMRAGDSIIYYEIGGV